MTDEQRKKSGEMAEEMYEAISKIVNERKPSMIETTNASMAVMVTVLQLALEQVEDRRNKEAAGS
jgi:hypothetical protein